MLNGMIWKNMEKYLIKCSIPFTANQRNHFYITEFNYGSEKKEIEKIEKTNELAGSLKSLITNELGRNFHLQRIIRINERNKFSFIKPKSLRYWLRSIAIKDADEVFSGLIKAGY